MFLDPLSQLPPTHAPHWQRPLPSGPDVNCGFSPRPERARQQLHGSSSVPDNELPPKICRHQPQTLPWHSIHHKPHGTPGSTEQPLLWFGSVQTLDVHRMRPLTSARVHQFDSVPKKIYKNINIFSKKMQIIKSLAEKWVLTGLVKAR